MSFGNSIAERSRKRDLIKTARIIMVTSVPIDYALKLTANWHRLTVKELEAKVAQVRAEYDNYDPMGNV